MAPKKMPRGNVVIPAWESPSAPKRGADSTDAELLDTSLEWQPFEQEENAFELVRKRNRKYHVGNENALHRAGHRVLERPPTSKNHFGSRKQSKSRSRKAFGKSALFPKHHDLVGFPSIDCSPIPIETDDQVLFPADFGTLDDGVASTSDSSSASSEIEQLRNSQKRNEINAKKQVSPGTQSSHKTDPDRPVTLLFNRKHRTSSLKSDPWLAQKSEQDELQNGYFSDSQKQRQKRRVFINEAPPSVRFFHRSDEERKSLFENDDKDEDSSTFPYSDSIDFSIVETFWEKNMKGLEAGFESLKQDIQELVSLEMTDGLPSFCASPSDKSTSSTKVLSEGSKDRVVTQNDDNRDADSVENLDALHKQFTRCTALSDEPSTSHDSFDRDIDTKNRKGGAGLSRQKSRTSRQRLGEYVSMLECASDTSAVPPSAPRCNTEATKTKEHQVSPIERKKDIVSKTKRWLVSQGTPSPQNNSSPPCNSSKTLEPTSTAIQDLQQPILEQSTTLPAPFGTTLGHPDYDKSIPRVFPLMRVSSGDDISTDDKNLRTVSSSSPTSVTAVLEAQRPGKVSVSTLKASYELLQSKKEAQRKPVVVRL